MLENKTEGKKLEKGRNTLIGVCVGIIGIFSFMIIRSLYICNTRETMDCTFDTFSTPLAAISAYTVLLLIAMFKYEWIVSKKKDSNKERMYLAFMIILLVLMLTYYIYS